MSEKIKLVRGDTRPKIRVNLTDEVTGEAIDLTGATVLMLFRKVGESTLTDTLTGVVVGGVGDVVFTWNTNSLAESGEYEGEIQVDFPSGGGRQTVYSPLKFSVRDDF